MVAAEEIGDPILYEAGRVGRGFYLHAANRIYDHVWIFHYLLLSHRLSCQR